MSDHYYSSDPTSASRPRSFSTVIAETKVSFESDNGVFSADKVDKGSRIMLETLIKYRDWSGVKTLDIGCGYGTLGIALAKYGANVLMCDVNERALSLCRSNIKANGVDAECVNSDCGEGIEGEFDTVVTNPPIRAGKKIVYTIFDNAYKLLKQSGEFYVVIRKQQGAESAARHIEEVFGNCKLINRDAGYHILYAMKE